MKLTIVPTYKLDGQWYALYVDGVTRLPEWIVLWPR